MDEIMIHAASEAYLEQQNGISSEQKKKNKACDWRLADMKILLIWMCKNSSGRMHF